MCCHMPLRLSGIGGDASGGKGGASTPRGCTCSDPDLVRFTQLPCLLFIPKKCPWKASHRIEWVFILSFINLVPRSSLAAVITVHTANTLAFTLGTGFLKMISFHSVNWDSFPRWEISDCCDKWFQLRAAFWVPITVAVAPPLPHLRF